MNCPRCGKQVPGGAAFCMHCGQVLAGVAVPRATPQATAPRATGAMPSYMPASPVAADIKKRNSLIAMGVAALLLILLFMGLKASGVLNFGAKPPDVATLNAKGALDNSLLQARGDGTKPTLQSARKTMPDDIYNWLEHLARCEKKKQALTGTQDQQLRELQTEMQGASGLTTAEDAQKMSDPDYNSFSTLDKATAMLNQLQPDWIALKKEFDSVPPPPECQSIADSYDTGLENIIDVFGSIEKLVGGVNLTDQNSIRGKADDVKKVGLDHRRGIDGEFQQTDDLVQDICDKYETKKWFKIDAHGGGAGLMGY